MRRVAAALTAAIALLATSACSDDAPSGEDGSPTASSSTPEAPTPEPPPEDVEVITYGDGGIVTSDADVDGLNDAPADFATFLKAALKKDAGDCGDPQYRVMALAPEGWATGNYFAEQCGGSAVLWTKADGTWVEAWSGQTLYPCDVLEKYRFPTEIAGETCDDGKAEVTYPRA